MANRWKMLAIIILIAGVALFGLSLLEPDGESVSATTLVESSAVDTTGFARAIDPYEWSFPRDFGAHPEFQTEWWYYTGNLADSEGRRFGYQFTIFRRAMTPQAAQSESEWRTNQLYLVHFTVSDIASQRFYHDERFSRGSTGLAGAQAEPLYHVWLEDWEILALDEMAQEVSIRAKSEQFAIDLILEQVKPPALQGDGGLSPKSAEAGNASYYYSLSRLMTSGTITLQGEVFTVEGVSWKDHEFSTSALGQAAQGWDWFGLIFDNNTEMMLGQIRLTDGGTEPAFGGMMIYEDGSTEYLPSSQFTITPTGTWVSPHTGAEYPSGWQMRVETARGTLEFEVIPLQPDQELADTEPSYWEGAVRIQGDVSGYGYAELTGYTDTMQNRF